MVRRPCCEKEGLNRGPWTPTEDKILSDYIQAQGEGKWRDIPQRAGLKRCGKSCRNRWLNYLRPDIKRGNISTEEDDLIIRLHNLLGNRWSLIAGRLPGRTDNEIKNYWNNNLRKRVLGLDNINTKRSTNIGEGNKVARDRLIRSTSPSDNSNQVIRTKAIRFTKVEDIPRLLNDHEDQMAVNDDQSQTSSSLVDDLQEHNKHSFDFLKDFDVNDVLISDMFFNCDTNVGSINYRLEDAEVVGLVDHENTTSLEHIVSCFDDSTLMSKNQWDIGDFFQSSHEALDFNVLPSL